jgi:hypothetical protein
MFLYCRLLKSISVFVDMFMIHLYTKFHVTGVGDSLAITIKPKAKYSYIGVNILLFYVVQNTVP